MRCITLGMLAAVLLWAPLSLAQPASLELSSLSPLQARPGEFITAVFALRNLGSDTDTFAFELALPRDYTLVSPLSSRSVPSGDEALVFVTALVPRDAPAGPAALTLTAVPRSDPASRPTAQSEIQVVQASRLTLVPLASPPAVDAPPQARFALSNHGNERVSVEVTADSAHGFTLSTLPSHATLAPGERIEIVVTVRAPSGAGARQAQDRVTVTIASPSSPKLRVQAGAGVALSPPPPDRVSTFLGWRMPARFGVEVSETADPTQPPRLGVLARFEGGGEFAAGNRFDVRLALDRHLNLRRLLVALEGPLYALQLGEQTPPLGAFAQLNGRGARLTLRSPGAPENAQLTVAAVAALSPLPLGAQVRLSAFNTHLSLSAVSRLNAADTDTVLEGSVARETGEALSLALHGALSTGPPGWDGAFLAKAQAAHPRWRTTLEASGIGPAFPHPRADQRRLELRNVLSLEKLVLLALFDFDLDNASDDPSRATTARLQGRLVSQGYPGPLLPTFVTRLSLSSAFPLRGPGEADRLSLSGSVSVRQPFPLFSALLSLGVESELDRLAGTNVGTLELGSLLGWNAGGLSLSLGVDHHVTLDLDTGLVLEQSPALRLVAGARTPLGTLSLRFKHAQVETELGAYYSATVGDTSLGASVRTALQGGAPAGFEASLSLSHRFALPVPFVPRKGQIEGWVFRDLNGNGHQEAGEGLGGLIVGAGGLRAVTDPFGFFRFPPLEPGFYEVSLEDMPLDTAPLRAQPQAVTLPAGRRVDLQIPLRPVAVVDGRVFNDADRDGERDPSEAGLGGVRIVLTGEGVGARATRSTVEGRFSFVDVPPGDYTVRLDEGTLPPRSALTTPNPVELAVEGVGRVEVRFGAAERQPEIRITTSAPSADFSVAPEAPRAGETVSFDASASADPDGEIVDYAWDFNGDGDVDARGVRVEFAFDAPGEATVTLTVTDDSGNSAQASRVLRIRP